MPAGASFLSLARDESKWKERQAGAIGQHRCRASMFNESDDQSGARRHPSHPFMIRHAEVIDALPGNPSDTATTLTRRTKRWLGIHRPGTFSKAAGTRAIPPIMGPRTHAAWPAAPSVFDGARVFEGMMPISTALRARQPAPPGPIGLEATMDTRRDHGPGARGRRKKFSPGTALYVKPMYWGEAEGSTRSCPTRNRPASASRCSRRRCRRRAAFR